MNPGDAPVDAEDFSTIEVARLLGLSVRSVQLMVDRGELDAWKTPGGHRRISGASIGKWRVANGQVPPPIKSAAPPSRKPRRPTVLLIDDSVHSRKLVTLLVAQHFPRVGLHVADDGIAGLVLYGKLQPDVLIVDIVLPGIDGGTLVTSLRSHPQLAPSRLAIVTSLDEKQRAPYAFALKDLPVIHKPRLVTELPAVLSPWLSAAGRAVR